MASRASALVIPPTSTDPTSTPARISPSPSEVPMSEHQQEHAEAREQRERPVILRLRA